MVLFETLSHFISCETTPEIRGPWEELGFTAMGTILLIVFKFSTSTTSARFRGGGGHGPGPRAFHAQKGPRTFTPPPPPPNAFVRMSKSIR